jgi:hypothetical protein
LNAKVGIQVYSRGQVGFWQREDERLTGCIVLAINLKKRC